MQMSWPLAANDNLAQHEGDPMRDNGPVSGREIEFPDDSIIVSKTNTSGRITFVNRTFIEISGFSEAELIGAPHNVLRHPDMPKEAFADLWATIKAGMPWEGLVKNRTRSGDHYWVRANVTPIVENGAVVGYISIRTKPDRAEVDKAGRIYAAVRNGTATRLAVREGTVVRTGVRARLAEVAASISGRMLAAFTVTILMIVLVGWLGLGGMGASNDRLRTVNDQRVLFLRDLKVVSDAYAVFIVDATHKVRNGNFTVEEGIRSVGQASRDIAERDSMFAPAFAQSRLAAEESRLLAESASLKGAADAAVTELTHILDARDRGALDRFVRERLYQSVDPLTDKLGALVDLQLRLSGDAIAAATSDLQRLTWMIGCAIVLAIAVTAAFGQALRGALRRPLSRLEELFDVVAQGEFTTPIDAPAVPEFRHSFAQLRALRAKLAYNVLEARENDLRQKEQVRKALLETCKAIEDDLDLTWIDVERTSRGVATGIAHLLESLAAVRESTLVVSAAAEQASVNASTVAAATEELSAAGAEIAHQATRSSTVARRAASGAQGAAVAIERMEVATGDISQVATLIASIAKQTNLLALNAGIEAARAGEAGKGFAVVANEVKSLAGQTARATEQIARQIDGLRATVGASVGSIRSVIDVIQEIDQAAAATAAAVEQQAAANAEIGRSAAESAGGAGQVSDSVSLIRDQNGAIATVADDVDRRVVDTQQVVANLRRRLVIALRQSVAGDRRLSDRIPCEIPVTLSAAGRNYQTTMLDIAHTGFLVHTAGLPDLAEHDRVEIELAEVGNLPCAVAGLSDLGLHLGLLTIPATVEEKLERCYASLMESDRPFIEAAQGAAKKVGEVLSESMARGEISENDLFSTDLMPVPGTDPEQFTAPYIELLDRLLPPVQEPMLDFNRRVRFCAAVNTAGYLPTHNKQYSQPQHPGERDWNIANCRNRRVFSDRAGLAAARNTRPFLVQAYKRDMGSGQIVRLKEVDAPIMVNGRHWGGLRLAYQA
jgi:PAS domain S-box-containing protein